MASCGNSAQVRATDFQPLRKVGSSIHLLGCLGEVLYVTLRRRAKTRSLNSSDSHTARVTGAFSPSKLISPQTQQHRTMQSSQNLLTIIPFLLLGGGGLAGGSPSKRFITTSSTGRSKGSYSTGYCSRSETAFPLPLAEGEASM